MVCAADGEAALRIATRQPFDVILVDLALPKKDGRTVLQRMRARPGPNATTPVLALSAAGDPTTAEQAMDEGFEGLAAKPLAKIELISAVIHALALARGAAAPVRVAS